MTKVFLNPGHDPADNWTDYYDRGADNGILGLYENTVAAAVGSLAENYLKEAGCEVKRLQDEDLKHICNAANMWGADIFVSIHCNAFDSVAHGTETIVYPSDGEGKKLAECIQNQIVGTFGTVDRGVKQRSGLAVLNGTDMPAVLVEMAFIDNMDDALLLRDRQDDFARAIARGVTDYLIIERGKGI